MREAKNAKRIVLFIGLISVMLSFIACGTSDKPETPQQEKGKMVKSVEVVNAKSGDIALTLNATGAVEPDTSVTVISQVEGELRSFPFKEGDNVKKGQVIAQIDDKEIQAQIVQSEADLEYAQARLKAISAGARPQEIEQAIAQVNQMQASWNSAKKDLQHTKELYLGAIPRQQLDNAEGKYKNTVAQVESVKVKLDNAKKEQERIQQLFDLGAVATEKVDQAETNYKALLAQLHAVQVEIENAEVALKNTKELYDLEAIPRQKIDDAEAKFFISTAQLQATQEKLNLLKAGPALEDVEVARTQVKQAEAKLAYMKLKSKYYTIASPISGAITDRFVSQGDVVISKQKLLAIADISHVVLIASVSELDISKVKPGQVASVRVDAYPNSQFKGKVTSIYPIADAKTRSIPVEIRLPNPDKQLLPGMFARITFMIEQRKNVVLLPADAIVTKEGKKTAFVVKDSQIHVTPVQIGVKQGNRVEIKAGISPGDKVVITGQSELKDGMKVKIAEKRKPSGSNASRAGTSAQKKEVGTPGKSGEEVE